MHIYQRKRELCFRKYLYQRQIKNENTHFFSLLINCDSIQTLLELYLFSYIFKVSICYIRKVNQRTVLAYRFTVFIYVFLISVNIFSIDCNTIDTSKIKTFFFNLLCSIHTQTWIYCRAGIKFVKCKMFLSAQNLRQRLC